MGISSARGGTEVGCAVEASADGGGSARAAQRQVRQPANRDVLPSPRRLKTSRKQRKPTCSVL